MENRDIEYLASTAEFKDFRNKFKLDSLEFDHSIFFKNNCLLFHLYGFLIEDFLYFDIVDLKSEARSTFRRMIPDSAREEILEIYSNYKKKHSLINKTKDTTQNEIFREIEIEFFLHLEVMDKLLTDLLDCNLRDYAVYFEKINVDYYNGEVKKWFYNS